MRSADFITLYAGVCVGLAYVLASLARTWLLTRQVASAAPADRSAAGLRSAVIEVIVVLAWVAVVHRFIDAVAPGSNAFRNTSAVGFLSSKALTVWESVSLWAGLAGVVGFVAPFPRRGADGSSGLASAGALLAVTSPITFLSSIAMFFAGINLLGDARRAVPIALGSAAGIEWLLSMLRVRPGLGLVNGPETTLWVVMLAGVLMARWSHGSDGPGERRQ